MNRTAKLLLKLKAKIIRILLLQVSCRNTKNIFHSQRRIINQPEFVSADLPHASRETYLKKPDPILMCSLFLYALGHIEGFVRTFVGQSKFQRDLYDALFFFKLTGGRPSLTANG